MNTTMDTLMIEIKSTSTDATSAIDKLAQSLENLRNQLSGVVDASKGLSNLKNISSNIKQSNFTKKKENIESNLPSTQFNKSNFNHGNTIDPNEVESIRNLQNMLEGLSSTMNKLGLDIGKFDWTDVITKNDRVIRTLKDDAGNTIKTFQQVKNGVQQFSYSVKLTNPNVKKFSDKLNKMNKVMSGVTAKVVALGTSMLLMAKKAIGFVEMAAAEAEAMNLFTVTMGEYAEQGTKWVERFSEALYLDPVSVKQYMGSFNSLVKGLGVGAENSYKMSKNLTQLVYDLSSFKNISIESAYEKLMSGVSGELEPLRNVGVAMSEATLQTLAYELGIEKLVRNMTEAEKAQLRYIQIMRSSSEWQTDMGRTIITPANALRVLKQQFVQLGRAIGKVFIPIVMELMPYVIALTQMLTALANKLANFLGYEIADIDYSGLGDISAGITDIGDSADKTADKLNTMLAPFDDLNVVQQQTKSTSSGLSGIGGDLGIDLPEYDALANLNEEFAKGVEKAKQNLEKIIPIVKAIGIAFATWKITEGVLSFITGGTTIVNGLKKIYNGVKKLTSTKILSTIKKYLPTITKISGALVGIITTIMGANGVYNVVKKLGEGTKFTSQAFLLLTGNIAETTAGLSLAGLAIGGPIGAAIGALTGLVVSGISAWKGYKDGITELAKSKVFGDINISTQDFSKALNTLQFSFTATNKVISDYNETMTSLASNFDKSSQKVDSYLAKFQYLGESISGETGEAFKIALDKLFADANSINETGTQYSLDLWTTSFKGMTSMTAEEQGNILKIVQENGNYVSSEMSNAQNTINSIWSNAIATRGYLTQEEYNTIQQMLNKIRELTGNEMTKTQADIEYYKKIFGDKNYKLDEETYDNYLKARKDFEKEKKELIKENYTAEYADLDKQLKTLEERMKTANESEKKELKKQMTEIQNAQKEVHDERVKKEKELEKELKNIDNTITQNLKDQYKELLKETDKNVKEQRKIIEGIFKDLNIDMSSLKTTMKTSGAMCAKTFGEEFNKKQLKLKINPNSSIGFSGASIPFTASWYEEGGYPSSGDLFFANENGVPELVGRIGNQTAVANNDQITTSITNALLSALNQYDFGGGKSPTTIYIGNRKVYEGYGDYVADENDRYGTNMIKI